MTDTTSDAQEKTIESLQQELAAKRADLLAAQRGHQTGELANPRSLGVYRREIARLLTQINALQRKGAK